MGTSSISQALKSGAKRFILSGTLYLALLLPLQKVATLFPGTGVRPAAFLPAVLGIFWGAPAGLAVACANFASDMLTLSGSANLLTASLLDAVINFVSAYLAYVLWHALWTERNERGLYIKDVRSLLKAIAIMVIVSFITAMLVSVDLELYARTQPLQTMPVLFLNNFEFCLILGIPALALLPFSPLPAAHPRPRPRQFVHVPAALCQIFGATAAGFLALYIFTGDFFSMCTDAPHHALWVLLAALTLFGVALLHPLTPPRAMPQKIKLTSSLKMRMMVLFSLVSMVLALALSALFFVTLRSTCTETAALWTDVFVNTAVVLNLVLGAFIFLMWIVEKQLTEPLYQLALQSDGNGKNELDILSRSLDFVVTPEDGGALPNNEYRLHIGLNDKDTNTPRFDTKSARRIIGEICLKHVTGYTATDGASGGWVGADETRFVEEESVLYTIFGATDEQVHAIIQELLPTLNIESVLLEKKGRHRSFVS